MKALLIVLLLALAGIGGYYYFKDHPLKLSQGPEASTATGASTAGATSPGTGGSNSAGTKDFHEVSALLQSDMDHIPANLRDARRVPAHAFDVKSRLAPHLGLHPEYQTLTQVCDLIIDADQQCGQHQARCGLSQPDATTSAADRARFASGGNATAYQQQEVLWESQRRLADGKVRQLLATLENRRL